MGSAEDRHGDMSAENRHGDMSAENRHEDDRAEDGYEDMSHGEERHIGRGHQGRVRVSLFISLAIAVVVIVGLVIWLVANAVGDNPATGEPGELGMPAAVVSVDVAGGSVHR